MGLFPRFDLDGPERFPDAPRKTGLPRLWQIVRRDIWDIFKAGFLALLGCLPFIGGVFFAAGTHAVLPALLSGFIGGAIAGPELCALADVLLRTLRDDPVTGWKVYRKAWKRSAKASLLPGALTGVLLATQVFILAHGEALQLSLPINMALILGMLFLLGISLYLWPQLALMELSLGRLIKNSALLFIGQLPRTAAALAVLTVYILASLRFFAFALSLLPVTNLWLPALPAVFLIYPGLEQAFQIEEKFRDASQAPEKL